MSAPAGAAYHVPVVIDGFIAGAAALLAYHLCPPVREYLIAAHNSAEIGHRVALEHMELAPLLNLDLRLGTTNKQLSFINAELEKASNKVKQMEDALTKYREDNHAQSLDERTNMVSVRLNQLNETAIHAHSTRLTKEAGYNQVKDADPKSDPADEKDEKEVKSDRPAGK